MKVVWVLENIEKSKNFYSKFNILLLLASVHLWRKNHPEDSCFLYADDITIDFLDKLKVLEFWHNIRPIPNPRKINKSVFWASSKLQVLSEIDEPIIIMDNDTHVYKPIKHLLQLDKHYVCNFEIGKGYYPNAVDPYIKQLTYKTRWKTDSVNVAFLNLPDPGFTKTYAELSLQLMEELTVLKAPNPQYLIFSEQLLLKHLLDENNLNCSSIISTYWDCKKWDWGTDHINGLWSFKESGLYFRHYGPEKRYFLDSKTGYNYNEHINHLLNCINFTNLDLTKIPKR